MKATLPHTFNDSATSSGSPPCGSALIPCVRSRTWKLSFAIATAMSLVALQAKAASYQFIAPSGTQLWSYRTAGNWNQSGPWNGTPPTGGPTGSDNLDLAAPVPLTVDGSRSINNVTTSASGQQLQGTNVTNSLSVANNLTLSGSGASLTMWNGTGNGITFAVNVTGNANIGAGTTAYLGDLSYASFRFALSAFTVGGTTTIDGTVLNHFLNTGASTISFGDLNVSSSGLLVGAADGGVLTYLGGARVSTLSAKSLSGSGAIYGSSSGNTAGTRDVTLNLQNASVENTSFSGILSNTTVTNATNKLHLAVNLAGSQTLSGTNTYTGATTITAGTLLITGASSINTTSQINLNGGKLSYTSSVALNRAVSLQGGNLNYNSASNYTGTLTFTAGTLSGTNWNGNLGGVSIGSGQILSPGNSPGTAPTTSQTWAGGGTYVWELNNANGTAGADPGWDLITGSGSLAITATSGSKFNIDVTSLTLGNISGDAANFDSALDYAWKLADFTGAITLDMSAFNIDTTNFENTFTGAFGIARGDAVGIGGDSSQLFLVYTAVPEPSSLVLGGFGIICLMLFRRGPHRKNAA